MLGDTQTERNEPHLFLVLEGADPRAGGARHRLANVDEVVFVRSHMRGTRRVTEGKTNRLIIEVADSRMSGQHARIVKDADGFALEDLKSKNGTRINGMMITRAVLRDGDVFDLGRTIFIFRAAIPTPILAPPDLDERDQKEWPAGLATLLPDLSARLHALAKVDIYTPSPILLLGEAGAGKKALARALHQHSKRVGPFTVIRCGAFTTPEDDLDFVREAGRGTLFLDELGDLQLASQDALLRVLEKQLDVHIIGGTHAPLDELVVAGELRAELYARFTENLHRIPPLRERREDLGSITGRLLERISSDPITLTAETARAIVRHDWPRNVRELELCLTTSCVAAPSGEIEVSHLPQSVTAPKPVNPTEPTDEEIKKALHENLIKCEGNVSHVARAMGKARTQITRWMKRYGFDSTDFKGNA